MSTMAFNQEFFGIRDHLFHLFLNVLTCMVLCYILKSPGFENLVISRMLQNHRGENKYWDRSVRKITPTCVLRARP